MTAIASSIPLLPRHEYTRPRPKDSRSPCPALNALANHGYLPRDGRNVSVIQLVQAIRDVYHFSWLLALMLAAVGVIACGNGWTVNLHDLAKHNIIEHDGSMVHRDSPSETPFASVAVDRSLLYGMLRISPLPTLSLEDFAAVRALRDATLRRPLSKIHARIAYSEAILAFLVLSTQDQQRRTNQNVDDKVVPKSFLEDWLGEEKLPNGWMRPLRAIGILEVSRETSKFRDMVRRAHTRNPQG